MPSLMLGSANANSSIALLAPRPLFAASAAIAARLRAIFLLIKEMRASQMALQSKMEAGASAAPLR